LLYYIETDNDINNINIKFAVTSNGIYVYAILKNVADTMDYELKIKINSINIENKNFN